MNKMRKYNKNKNRQNMNTETINSKILIITKRQKT